MANKRDDFSEATKRILALRVAAHCSNPKCKLPTLGPNADPRKAAVVQMIYDLRQQGMSLREIVTELKKLAIPSPKGKSVWGVETVRRILQNEKYKGHVLLQKTYVSNFFTGKRTNNGGELPKYLIEGHHEAIINS